MSDKILKALMQLFAIIANTERLTEKGRAIVEIYLRQQLSQSHVNAYLQIFDGHIAQLQEKEDSGKKIKRLTVNSVKVLRICTDINSELEQKQKVIVLIRLLEFVNASDEQVSEQEKDFLTTVAEVFNIPVEEYETCHTLVASKTVADLQDSPQFLLISNSQKETLLETKQIVHDDFIGTLVCLYISTTGMLFAKYFGDELLVLNGQPVVHQRVYVTPAGSVIRGPKLQPVYYSDMLRCFLMDEQQGAVQLSAREVEYVFKNGKKGLHAVSFSASSGNLIGIMGGSGAGKSTLLNILNGNLTPGKGEVLINGVNIHREKEKLEGVIGYVPQDDLLLEDLSVFQNLFYNSKLSFGNLNDEQITAIALRQLGALGLSESKDLKVGNTLNKTISGGQRKRLNIALELIRKPQVLFVDEPTSGLSSLDSENVMDLLKQLATSGKLIFVVIHQPSSDIFKLFDNLLILDTGGYPIYYGNPSESLIYFKNKAHFADADFSECFSCGNINSEQIFSIIESKMVDEFGNTTNERKISPKDWNQFHHDEFIAEINFQTEKKIKNTVFSKPSRMQQLSVFIKRDMLSKLYNRQYLLINFLEAPVLALILAYVLKYFGEESGYVFRDNINLPAFIFISVIVALFMGLTVSAEEIIRDQKILKRESFLNLSKSSYLLSKTAILFFISAIQTFSYVLIGNLIFGIQEMWLSYWLILFSVSCFANLSGLNISASFNSVVTIYILVPFLMIPQIILSGVMVKFEDLNPRVTSQSKVPLVGEVMASRWGFEALAVKQFKDNRYEKHFFEWDKMMSNATFKKDFWSIKMNDKLDSVYKHPESSAVKAQVALLKNELKKEQGIANAETLHESVSVPMDKADYQRVKNFLEQRRKHYIHQYKTVSHSKDSVVQFLIMRAGDREQLTRMKNDFTNESLTTLLLSSNDFNPIVEHDNRFIQRFRPIYMEGEKKSFVRAPLYVSSKNVFGKSFDTFWVNLTVIWLMTAFLFLTLYFDILKKGMDTIGRISERFQVK